MDWLTPSLIATMAATALLSLVYLYLYVHYRERYLAVWAFSWAIYFIRYIFMLFVISGHGHFLFFMANQTASLLSGIILLWGTYIFVEKSLPKVWGYSCAVGILWIFISIPLHFPFLFISIPTFTFLSIVYVWTGITFIRSNTTREPSRAITGGAFIAWGIHKANYPFLRPIPWFAPWGYLINALLEFIVALGMLLVYFNKVRTNLKQEQLFLEKAQEIGKIGSWSLDTQTNDLFWTDQSYRIFGIPVGTKLTYETFLNCVHPDDRAYVDRQWKTASNENPYDLEHRIVVEGETRWVHEKAELEFDEKGERISGLGVTHDITARKRSEEALRVSEERYRLLWDVTLEGILIHKNGVVTDLNTSLSKMLGYEKAELLGKNMLEVGVHPDDIPIVRENIIKEYAKPYTIRAVRKNGEQFFAEIEARNFRMKDQSVRVAAVRDITYRKHAEDALRESEEKFRSLVEQAAEMLFFHDLKGNLIDVNLAASENTGYSQEELKNMSVFDIDPDAHNRDDMQRHWESLRTGDPPVTFEASHKRKDGSIYPAEISLSKVVIRDSDYILGLARNITERKQAEAERKKLQEQLNQAQKMESIGILAGGIAHNFNNILMGIQGRASLMMLGKDASDPDYAHLKGIETYVKHAVELTRDILGFARGGKYETRATDLNTLIKQETELFGRTKKEIQIHETYETALWPVEVDQGQMKQVLLNLYVNAYQAMPAGGELYIQTRNVFLNEKDPHMSEIPPGKYIKISVTDTGIGMDEATRERVFDPFFSTKDVGQGSGLGLASVYGIIKNHSGFINVHSEKGIGTTFNIHLPASEKETTEQPHRPDRNEIQYGQGTILLVDDENMITETAQQLLELLGYEVLTALSGKEAIDLYQKKKDKIDLVILDLIMPGMGGGETFDRLKATDGNVKVLLSSGYTIDGQAQEILDRGCVGFIQKPFSLKKLSLKVHEILDRANG